VRSGCEWGDVVNVCVNGGEGAVWILNSSLNHPPNYITNGALMQNLKEKKINIALCPHLECLDIL